MGLELALAIDGLAAAVVIHVHRLERWQWPIVGKWGSCRLLAIIQSGQPRCASSVVRQW